MIYGYARVSTPTQKISLQISQLRKAGCKTIFKEKQSGRTTDKRPEITKLLETITEGDTVVVTKLDRLVRATRDALSIIDQIESKGASLVVLNMGGDKVDTSTAVGKLMLTTLAGIAEFEADMIRERQLEGIEAAKKRGVYKGRLKRFTLNNKRMKYAVDLFNNRDTNGMTVKEITEITQISRTTLYRFIREQKQAAEDKAE